MSSPRFEASRSLWFELNAWIFCIDLETLRWSRSCFKLESSLSWLLLPLLLIAPTDVTETLVFLADRATEFFSSNLTLFWSLFWAPCKFGTRSSLCVLYSVSNLLPILDDGKWCVWLRSLLCWLAFAWFNRWVLIDPRCLLPLGLYGSTIVTGKLATEASATFWTSFRL